jgi:hypothetical protein
VGEAVIWSFANCNKIQSSARESNLACQTRHRSDIRTVADISLMKTTPTRDESNAALAALRKYGVLLKQDKFVPDVVSIVTGKSLRRSWWSHPHSHRIFSVLSKLADDPAIALTKLLNCKDTFVHAPLWPALLAVGRAREDWQFNGLSDAASKLLELVDSGSTAVRATGPAAKELEVRLLVTAQQIHTDGGRRDQANGETMSITRS